MIIVFFLLVHELWQEKLWSMLRDVYKNKGNVDVVKLQKSGGVVSRNAKVRQKSRAYRIRVCNVFNFLCCNHVNADLLIMKRQCLPTSVINSDTMYFLLCLIAGIFLRPC